MYIKFFSSVSRSPTSSLPYGPSEDRGFNRSLQSALDRLGSQQYGLAAAVRLKEEQEEGVEERERLTNTVSPPRMSEEEKRL
jgi:hypothetical protein